jgi:glycosyl-4,4'-diaponeurosporenoate acyltransferase
VRTSLTHWAIAALGPVFFLWNPWWLALALLGYGLVANVPCLLVQRYNRARLEASSSERPPAGRRRRRASPEPCLTNA